MKTLDFAGEKYGRLTVVRTVEKRGSMHRVECSCECGNTKTVLLNNLRRDLTTSCGCYQREQFLKIRCKRSKNTNYAKMPEYKAWGHLIQRCENPKTKKFHNHGGRGIKVCKRWRDSFVDFLSDMGPRPSSKHSIERIDNDGDYEPGNCRWATNLEQSRNRRTNRWLTVDGETLCLVDMAAKYGMQRTTLERRLKRGWSVEEAAKTPVR